MCIRDRSYIDNTDELLKGINVGSQIWMSHGDTITVLPENFKVIASTDDVKAAAYHVEGEQTWGCLLYTSLFVFDMDSLELARTVLQVSNRITTAFLYPIHIHFKKYMIRTYII